ncbi:MAG: cell division protein ZipA [Halieaceae bacterium]
MDISVRDWMIIIGVLLIVAVLLDGYRRMRDPRRLRVSLSPVPDGDDERDDISVSHELPNGGARVLTRAETEQAAAAAALQSGAAAAQADSPPLESKAESKTVSRAESEAESETEPEAAPDEQGEPPLLTEEVPDQTLVAESTSTPGPESAALSRGVLGENLDMLQGMVADSRDEVVDSNAPAPAQEVLMLHVVAREPAGFPGDDILQVLLAYNLRFGEMDFFHRHEEAAGRGSIQFSVANMLQPGVFNIDAMSDFSTSGLIFFCSLPGPEDMMGAFEQMLETARGVAEHLGGDVLDESRSATTRQTLEHMRQRIRDLERKLLTQGKR